MMDQEEIIQGIERDCGIIVSGRLSPEEIMQELALKVSQLLQDSAERFFQLMYRLDIPEIQVQQAILGDKDVVDEIAGLIYQRQVRKIESRRQHARQTPDDPDLAW